MTLILIFSAWILMLSLAVVLCTAARQGDDAQPLAIADGGTVPTCVQTQDRSDARVTGASDSARALAAALQVAPATRRAPVEPAQLEADPVAA